MQNAAEKYKVTVVGQKLWPCMVFVAGGGKKLGGARFNEWQKTLEAIGISSVSFDFPGVADAEGNLEDTCLQDRIDITHNILDVIKTELNPTEIYVCGTSMGGFVALGVCNTREDIKKLIVDAPAAYAEELLAINFGEKFSEIIRTQESWKNSPSFTWLQNIKIPVLFIEHEADKVIPVEISGEYKKRLLAQDSRYILLEGAPHLFWEDETKEFRDTAFDEIVAFIKA